VGQIFPSRNFRFIISEIQLQKFGSNGDSKTGVASSDLEKVGSNKSSSKIQKIEPLIFESLFKTKTH